MVIDTETLRKQPLSSKIIWKYHLLKLYKLHDTTSLRSYIQIHLAFLYNNQTVNIGHVKYLLLNKNQTIIK